MKIEEIRKSPATEESPYDRGTDLGPGYCPEKPCSMSQAGREKRIRGFGK